MEQNVTKCYPFSRIHNLTTKSMQKKFRYKYHILQKLHFSLHISSYCRSVLTPYFATPRAIISLNQVPESRKSEGT